MTQLTKREARAVLAFQKKIQRACDELEGKLEKHNLDYALAYYLSHIRGAVNEEYGSAPTRQAEAVVGDLSMLA